MCESSFPSCEIILHWVESWRSWVKGDWLDRACDRALIRNAWWRMVGKEKGGRLPLRHVEMCAFVAAA